MTVDWEGLKALEAKATDAPWNLEHDNTFVAGPEIEKGDWDWIVVAEREIRAFYPEHLDDNNRFIVEWRNAFPAILAQHQRDQRVIAAAEKIINAVRGLAFGTDWNKGTHAEIYRPKLLAELAEFDKAKQ